MSKKILVTGGAGFIGSFQVDKLIELGHDVVILDNLDKQVHKSGKPSYLNEKAEFLHGDVRKKEDLKKTLDGVEVVFHFAAAVGVGQSMYETNYYVENNCLGTSNLLEYLINEEHCVKKIVVAASMSSYGEGLYKCEKCGFVEPELRSEEQMKKGIWEVICNECGSKLEAVPTPETKRLNCNSVYAQTKRDQEEMVLLIGKTYGIKAVSMRYFNVFGPRQSLSNPYTGVTAIFMSRIKNNKQPVVYEDGLQSRDFVSVHDIVEANVLAMDSEKANYEIFNVGSGKATTIKEVAETIAKLYNSNIKPKITNSFRKGDVRHCFADISKIQKKLDWKPKVSFEEGLREITEWAQHTDAVDRFEEASRELEKHGLV